MINSFVNSGNFEDPCSEFWIEKNPIRISKDAEKVPVFLQNCANDIFKTGKAIGLLGFQAETLVYF